MFQLALPHPERSKSDPLRPLLSDDQWLEYALLACSDDQWLNVVEEIQMFEPIQDGVATTGYEETDNLDREMYEKYVLKRSREAR